MSCCPLWSFSPRTKKIWYILLLWCLAVLELHAWLRSGSNILPTVIPNFLPGVVAYLAFRKFRAVLPAWTFLPFILVLLTVYMVSPLPSHSWPTILTLGFALPLFRQISMPALVWFSQKIARYSFGIYLWHSFGIRSASTSSPTRRAGSKSWPNLSSPR